MDYSKKAWNSVCFFVSVVYGSPKTSGPQWEDSRPVVPRFQQLHAIWCVLQILYLMKCWTCGTMSSLSLRRGSFIISRRAAIYILMIVTAYTTILHWERSRLAEPVGVLYNWLATCQLLFYSSANVAHNDVAGNFSLTLIDVLDTLVILDDPSGFDTAVRNVIEWVSFDVNTKPQVFETTIRVLGGLLSGHIFAEKPGQKFHLPWYRGELLSMAHDLGKRMLPAFDTPTGIPYARVNAAVFNLEYNNELIFISSIFVTGCRNGSP